MSDDGIGPSVVRLLRERWAFPAEVSLVDGGTCGLDLLPKLNGITRLIIIDAIASGASPGTLMQFVNEEISPALECCLSPHQLGLKELLIAATLIDQKPNNIVLFGMQPSFVGIGDQLTAAVSVQIVHLAEMVLLELCRWGIPVTPLSPLPSMTPVA